MSRVYLYTFTDGISPHMVADGLRNVKRMFNLNNAADDVEIKDEIETVSGQ